MPDDDDLRGDVAGDSAAMAAAVAAADPEAPGSGTAGPEAGDPSSDYDSPWKEALERYFEPFMALLWPALHPRIDWARPLRFLDKELQQIVRDAGSGRRHADKLVQVSTHEHGARLVLVHVEVEGRGGKGFAARMYRYYSRLRDVHPDAVIETLAVLTRRRRGPATMVHRDRGLSSTMEFRFGVVHLAGWLDRWPALEAAAGRNPFAVVVMAQLLAHHEGAPLAAGRLRGKIRLTRMLYGYGYDRQDVLELYRLIDWMIALSPDDETRFVAAGEQLEKEQTMAFVLTAERVGERKGRALGIQEGLREGMEKGLEKGQHAGQQALLRRQLSRRFGPLPSWVESRIAQAGPDELLEWADRVLDAPGLEGVFEPKR